MLCQVEDLLAHIVYCGCCGESTVYIKCKSVGYDLILNCCSILYYVLIVYLKLDYFFFLDAERLARSQQLEGPVSGHLDTGFSWFPWILQQILKWFLTVSSCHYILPMQHSLPKFKGKSSQSMLMYHVMTPANRCLPNCR